MRFFLVFPANSFLYSFEYSLLFIILYSLLFSLFNFLFYTSTLLSNSLIVFSRVCEMLLWVSLSFSLSSQPATFWYQVTPQLQPLLLLPLLLLFA